MPDAKKGAPAGDYVLRPLAKHVTVQIGLIAPPVGIICFIINNMVPDIGLVNIYKGAMPFVIADLIWLALLVAFPSISLVLVKMMG